MFFLRYCFFILILWLFLLIFASPSFADAERIPLTLDLLQERLNSPQIQEGISTIDLSYFVIDLTPENREFREQFYQQLQSRLNRSDKVIGLDFSHGLIQGDFMTSRLGLTTVLSSEALPQILTEIETKIVTEDEQFSSNPGDILTSVIVLRSPVKLNDTLITGKADFRRTFFLQKLEAKQAKFTQEIDFSQVCFARKANFSQAIFGRDVNFDSAKFRKQVKFIQAKFQGESQFIRSQFQEEVDFSQAEFIKLANFQHSLWSESVNFSNVNWQDRVIFSNSVFSQSVSFLNSTFEKSISFRKTYFRGTLSLKDVKLLGTMDFSNAEFFRDRGVNIAGLAFESDGAKIFGDTGSIGRVMYLNDLEGNETVLRNLIQNFRKLEQIPDGNQLEYKTQKLKQKQLITKILKTPYFQVFRLIYIKIIIHFLFLSLLLLLSDYGTNFNLIFGVGLITIGYFGVLFWLIDRCRRKVPSPILPNHNEIIYMLISGLLLLGMGMVEIVNSAENYFLTLSCLGLILFPIPVALVAWIYQGGRYHDLMETSYFVLDGGLRQLQLLIVRLPIIPEFPFFRDRYTPLVWERSWNWLNYYDFSLNNFLKLGFNDIRLRDQHIPGLITTLVWYQWSLGILYVVLLLWTLSRTIPGLNVLIYLK
ncbi:pentapeptide repeat-containing protein [Crocosphaera sp. UHCC 0190]|uniref:pentapeptide repeat-containing protein n=1 Tax=Crocosphaera sp. UHCC 0190 TaxID=3110246 RepID=UPI002B209CE6|nr:pentapeptide repeat-containing protein [Crocosphaera sp. UHCC 0190]MEA5510734.1 pentapeptide repeat-containing protein [Crocosphaera sp. UHCC 0190]